MGQAGLVASGSRILCLVGLALLVFFIGGAASAQTRYVIYYNSAATPLEKVASAGYTDVILSFLTVDPDGAGSLKLVVPATLKDELPKLPAIRASGKRILISFGGGDMKTRAWKRLVGREVELAGLLSEFVKSHGLDGVDIDFEISEALEERWPKHAFDGVSLLIDLTKALEAALPSAALITHAPQPPYLDPKWQGGPYLKVLKAAGEHIDWISIQYYNNPGYETPAKRYVVGEPDNPFVTAYIGLVEATIEGGWPAAKILVGKPVFKGDAASGHMPPERVVSEIVKPLLDRYGEKFGGLMGWQYSDLTRDHRYWNDKIAPVLLPGAR
ncbi:MAG: glycosyl hydrolase family 18 protein [Alphaproteobacteria bacterium]|jgi:chitinase|nr:glycosyl hydrolase family 18 protein [Alphaproteobacteria bacterium]